MSAIRTVSAAAIIAVCALSPALFSQAAEAQDPAITPTPTPTTTPAPVPTVEPTPVPQEPVIDMKEVRRLRHKIRTNRRAVWKWQATAFKHRSHTRHRERQTRDTKRLKRMLKYWRNKRLKARHAAMNPPHESQWRCIHYWERDRQFRAGSKLAWATNTGNGYYGGLQMNWDFMRTYGARLLRKKGPANNWTWFEQMWVAEQAHKKRGFTPWPNTAHFCGLI